MRLWKRWRLHATAAEFPDRNSEFSGLVSKVFLNAGAWKNEDTDRHDVQHGIVTSEGRRLGVSGPVGLEDDLCDLAVFSPAGRNQFGTPG